MSISYSTDIVFGFPVEIQAIRKKRTKYDEDTGEPYEVDELSHHIAVCEGKTIATNENNPDEFCQGEKTEGLEWGESGFDGGQKWLGVIINELGDYKGMFSVIEPAMPGEVMAFGLEHDITPKLLASMTAG